MILAGDEMGHTQSGNNNAYNQDNETAWLDWHAADQEFTDFTARLIAFRQTHPVLCQNLFLHSRERAVDGVEDLFWWREDGDRMQALDWHDPARHLLIVEKRTAAGTPAYNASAHALLMVFNAGDATAIALPETPDGQVWRSEIDTSAPEIAPANVDGVTLNIAGQCVRVLVLRDSD